ncbi:MAG TPA: redoxin domain-containing protein, partial [Parvularculaceae bacterium]|nr:redoxin domain-containing protein [Parvularculaceae bacterium]
SLMIGALVISQFILGALVLALAVVCFALARQIGVLHERIAPAGALAVNQRLKIGDKAPELSLVALDSRKIDVDATGKSRLFFFLSPDCPVCKTLLPIVGSIARAEGDWLDVVLASDGGDAETHRAFQQREKLDAYPYVLSEILGRSFGVSKLPYAVLVDGDAKIAGMGLVNSREHLESLFEAKERGVASLQEFAARRAGAVHEHQQRVGA